MPGANYMGGKRNAMKARAKDTEGRQQKDFFGRQRFEMLSRGLAASKLSKRFKSPSARSSSRKGLGDISFAHAGSSQKTSEIKTAIGYIPNPVHISPSTPCSRQQTRAIDAHISSSRGRSDILDMLDTSEPLFLRRVLNKILDMPDLACLTSCDTRRLASTSSEASQRDTQSSHIQERKRKIQSEDEIEPTDHLTRTPLRKKQAMIDDIGYYRRPEPRVNSSSPILEAPALEEDENHLSGGDDFNNSDYMGFFDTEFDDVYSSSWSIVQHKSPARRRSDRLSDPIRRSLPIDQDLASSSPLSSHADCVHRDGAVPLLIQFGGKDSGNAMGQQSDMSTAFGSLFEQPDPWSTIGSILGLSDDGMSTRKRQGASVVEEDYDGECKEDQILLNMISSKTDEAKLADHDEDFNMDGLGSSPYTSPTRLPEPEIILTLSQKNHLRSPKLPCEKHAEPKSSSYSELKKKLDIQVDELLWDDEEDTLAVEVCEIPRGSFNSKSEDLPSRSDVDIEYLDSSAVVAGTDMVTLDSNRDHSFEKSSDFLAVIDLEEADGKFLGPSLFNGFCSEESED